MKILTGSQIREADLHTIANEPISSLDLMERASIRLSEQIAKIVDKNQPLLFFIGKGNNGGDGLAIARLLSARGYKCSIQLLFGEKYLSKDCYANLQRLPKEVPVSLFDHIKQVDIDCNTVIIDAILGSGVKGMVAEPIASIIRFINSLSSKVISIDLPSGMKTEWQEPEKNIIKADYTLTIELPKLGMLLPDAGEYCGNIIIVPIGLSKDFISHADSKFFFVEEHDIRTPLLTRDKFGHKNTYGHALLICGSRNMSGAATLCTGGAIHSGCGLVTAHIPYNERYGIMSNYPSAMFSFEEAACFSTLPKSLEKYSSIAIGCGLGQTKETIHALEQLLSKTTCPLVIDADAINIIAKSDNLKSSIPKNSILTPHVGELKRLIGEWSCEEEKLKLTSNLSSLLESVIILKGAYTTIFLPNRNIYFNSTGNPGMAKAGSGDVLTGLLCGLISRGYKPSDAAIVGVFLHGLSGDLAASALGQEAMTSQDIIRYIPYAFKQMGTK